MLVRIELLRHPQQAQEVLREDGWSLQQEAAGRFRATHPQVRDEPAARARLVEAGLLVSRWVRIAFRQTRD